MAQSKLIQHINQYVLLPGTGAAAVLQHSSLLSFKKKEHLLKEGQVCKNLYFIEKGCLRLYFVNNKGVEQTTQFAIENWWIADYMSYTNQSPSQFYIQAVENSVIYAVEYTQQEALVQAVPVMEKYFRMMLQKAFAASQLRIKYLYEMSREEVYRHFINAYPGFVQRIPQYMLASYLGFTPEYLSGLRKKIH
jgi:CRP/FNR family transcriptional regulator, anaerobic regulatory protein